MPIPTMATSLMVLPRACSSLPATGAKAKVTTSRPSSSVVNGTITSSTGMPMRSRSGSFSVRRDSTITPPSPLSSSTYPTP